MKKYILFFALALGAVSCTLSDPVRDPSPEDIPCGVYFLATDKAAKINLPVATVEATDTKYTYHVGRTNNQGDLTVGLVNHSDPCFTVPSSVSFKNGEYTAKFDITFSSVPAEDTPVNIEIAPEYVSYYAAGAPKLNVALNCLWENLGMGQWFCWYYEEIWDVRVQKSKVPPVRYRVLDVYTEAQIVAAGGASILDTKLIPEFLEFTLTDEPSDEGGEFITWDKWFYIGANYQGVSGQPIKAYLPSALNSSQADYDYESSNIGFGGKLFEIAPYFYIDGLGGFGVQYCYLSLPGGPDLRLLL